MISYNKVGIVSHSLPCTYTNVNILADYLGVIQVIIFFISGEKGAIIQPICNSLSNQELSNLTYKLSTWPINISKPFLSNSSQVIHCAYVGASYVHLIAGSDNRKQTRFC